MPRLTVGNLVYTTRAEIEQRGLSGIDSRRIYRVTRKWSTGISHDRPVNCGTCGDNLAHCGAVSLAQCPIIYCMDAFRRVPKCQKDHICKPYCECLTEFAREHGLTLLDPRYGMGGASTLRPIPSEPEVEDEPSGSVPVHTQQVNPFSYRGLTEPECRWPGEPCTCASLRARAVQAEASARSDRARVLSGEADVQRPPSSRPASRRPWLPSVFDETPDE